MTPHHMLFALPHMNLLPCICSSALALPVHQHVMQSDYLPTRKATDSSGSRNHNQDCETSASTPQMSSNPSALPASHRGGCRTCRTSCAAWTPTTSFLQGVRACSACPRPTTCHTTRLPRCAAGAHSECTRCGVCVAQVLRVHEERPCSWEKHVL